MPSTLWNLLLEKPRDTVLQLVSVLLDVVLVIVWFFLMHLAKLGFDWIGNLFGPGSTLDPVETWLIDAAHHALSVATFIIVFLYVGFDIYKIILRLRDETRVEVYERSQRIRGTHEE